MGGGRGASVELWLCDASGRLFRGGLIDLCGIGGRADVGGSAAGRESTGRAVVIEVDMAAVKAEVQLVPIRMCLPSIEVADARPGQNCAAKTVVLPIDYESPAYMCRLSQVKSRAFTLRGSSPPDAMQPGHCRSEPARFRRAVFA